MPSVACKRTSIGPLLDRLSHSTILVPEEMDWAHISRRFRTPMGTSCIRYGWALGGSDRRTGEKSNPAAHMGDIFLYVLNCRSPARSSGRIAAGGFCPCYPRFPHALNQQPMQRDRILILQMVFHTKRTLLLKHCAFRGALEDQVPTIAQSEKYRSTANVRKILSRFFEHLF